MSRSTAKPKAKAAASHRRDSKPIVRVQEATGAWWCPFCDRSHESKQRACDGCGAVRDGEEAVRP